MFTGIVQQIGQIIKTAQKGSLLQLTVKIPAMDKQVKIGDSIAINGVCLTVTTKTSHKNTFTFDVMSETVKRTTLSSFKAGDKVNTELAIMSGDPFGGHFVQGHIDTVGKVSSITKSGSNCLIQITCPPETAKSIIEKGSIAIDGVSLTAFDIRSDRFSLGLIPHTLKSTILGAKKIGDKVNIEVDMLGKYIQKLLPQKPPAGSRSDDGF
ncbi:MAG: riboflavin synthase [Planctomycetes bacterium]|nr:riboflavin synthase [Planctomycetota bacterium]